MNIESLNEFKIISSQKKNILKPEEEISNLESTLDSLKEEHTSLVNDQLNISNTLEEKVDVIKCDTSLKHISC